VLALVVLLSAVTDPILQGLVVGLALVIGLIIIVAGHRMRKLQSYPLAMTATALLFVAAIGCAPLALLGIWPLIVLLDADVKWAFSKSQLPDEQ